MVVNLFQGSKQIVEFWGGEGGGRIKDILKIVCDLGWDQRILPNYGGCRIRGCVGGGGG